MTEDDCPPRGRLPRINDPSAALKSYLRLNKSALFAQEVLPYINHNVPPQRVVFLRRFGLKTGIDFAHFGLESGVVFKGTTGMCESILIFGCVFLGKSTSGFPNPKTDFAVFFWQIQKKDHKIHTLGGFFGSNSNPDFWDSQSERFYGKGFEKIIFDKQFSEQKTRHYGRHNVIYIKARYSRDNSLGQAVPDTAILANGYRAVSGLSKYIEVFTK